MLEHDELQIPSSSPPRRLSRSSIDLRDLEAQHEREKIMSQNVSESVSSLYHCFDSHLRYSGSEPINTHLKVSENHLSIFQPSIAQDYNKQDVESSNSRNSLAHLSHKNNFELSTTKEQDINLINSTSIVKDNQVSSGCSINNTVNNNKKTGKKKILASSDSDFFSLIRYNSEKWRRINCFSVSTNNYSPVSSSVDAANNTNGNKPKNMIYALSDSDFLIGVSDKNKNLNLNNVRNNHQAIVNKSDIFNFLINQKDIDYKNLLDTNNCANNNQKKISDVDYKKQFDDPDLFRKDRLMAVFGESAPKAINESKSFSDDVTIDKLQKKETVSLPPIVSTPNDFNRLLNNSRSIDTVLLNIKNNSDKLCTLKSLHDFSANNMKQIEDAVRRNLLDKTPSSDLCESASIIKNDNVDHPSVISINDITSVANQNAMQENELQELNKSYTKYFDKQDVMNPATLDEKNITRRKRTPSNVTYNVNVINFQTDEESELTTNGYGKRSNSSTSEFRNSFIGFIEDFLK